MPSLEFATASDESKTKKILKAKGGGMYPEDPTQ